MSGASSIWLVVQSAPDPVHGLREAIDMALAALAFEIGIELLVTGAAAAALNAPDEHSQRFRRQLTGLLDHGLERIWVCATQGSGLTPGMRIFDPCTAPASFQRGRHLHV